MENLEELSRRVFRLFSEQWGLVTVGTPERCNACTVSWGSLGTLWTGPGLSGAVATVYLHPARYTCELLRQSDTFTLSFFPESCRPALAWLGSHSGRDGDKMAACGLTPEPMGEGVGFAEASLTLLCRKLYQHPFEREALDPRVRDYYKSKPQVYPPDEQGQWQPHWVFVGEILQIRQS